MEVGVCTPGVPPPPSPLWVYTFGGMGLPGVPLGGRRRRLQGWPPSRRASAPLGVAAGGSCLGVGLCAAGGGALLHHSAGCDTALRSVVHYCAAVCRNIMQYGAALRNVTPPLSLQSATRRSPGRVPDKRRLKNGVGDSRNRKLLALYIYSVLNY